MVKESGFDFNKELTTNFSFMRMEDILNLILFQVFNRH